MSCTCQKCGDKYKMDLIIPDELWYKITPSTKDKEAGMLCPFCIIKELNKLYEYSAYKLKRI